MITRVFGPSATLLADKLHAGAAKNKQQVCSLGTEWVACNYSV